MTLTKFEVWLFSMSCDMAGKSQMVLSVSAAVVLEMTQNSDVADSLNKRNIIILY